MHIGYCLKNEFSFFSLKSLDKLFIHNYCGYVEKKVDKYRGFTFNVKI
ncbi:hypothetical protein HNQ88_000774 [Aureibacter tunicatorum]|uniref:Uncharacterized protein n=1 Tax=Aureibacter tunicatorum TaxID=866807 RepID=A0AAE3XJC5_9BACT|nr:hypothetical protein [Aureibacter tunicatorum]BDD02833.1 hypothetical protein AUTU_03160 [Aureibacter tunicatorum]